jgi:hypothetical protein
LQLIEPIKHTYMKKAINSVRVVLPENPKEMLDLAAVIYEKHQAAGAQSSLSSLNWADLGPKITEAITFHKEAEELRKQMEKLYEQRNQILEPIDDLVRQSRDLLKVVYRSEPRKIGDYGFVVDNTPATGKTDKA